MSKKKKIIEAQGRTAIPAAGAVGGGDDYYQKIGRNKIWWTRKGFSGQPSQSADAGFSSFLGRVNRGHDLIDDYVYMFPDQADLEEYEPGEEEILLFTRKLPKYTGGRSKRAASPIKEAGIKMSKQQQLRQFVREAIKDEMEKRDVEQPGEFKLYRVKYLVPERETEFEDEETGFVNYKTDVGTVSYQPREAITESTKLRELIRIEAQKIVSEIKSKKKRKLRR